MLFFGMICPIYIKNSIFIYLKLKEDRIDDFYGLAKRRNFFSFNYCEEIA